MTTENTNQEELNPENNVDATTTNSETTNSPENKPEDKTTEKPKMTDAEANALKEVMKWKAKARELEAAKANLETTYAGLDVEAARAALAAREEAENAELEKKGEFDRLLEKQREKSTALIEAEKARATAAEERLSALAEQINDLTLGSAFANSKFINENLVLTPSKAKALYQSHFEIKDGEIVAYDKPMTAKNKTPLVDATGNPMSFEEAFAEIINSDPDKDTLLRAKQKPGANSTKSDGPAIQTKTYEDNVSKIAAGLAKLKKS